MPSTPSTIWTSSRICARPTSSRSWCASSSIPPGSWHEVADGNPVSRPPLAVLGTRPGDRVVSLDPRERLIVALDVPSVAEAEKIVARLGDAVSFYKIGYQLAFAGGIDFARALASAGKQVFLDLKLHESATRWPRASRASRARARHSSPCTPIRRPCMPRSMRARLRPAHPRRHRAHLLRRRRPRRGRL